MNTRKILSLLAILVFTTIGLKMTAAAADRQLLSAPFADDADVDIVQGWFYTSETVTADPCDSVHEGIDFATLDPTGSWATWQPFAVLAAAPGWAWYRWSNSYGHTVEIKHVIRDGGQLHVYYTLYAHLESVADKILQADTNVGTRVQRGEYVGTSGITGYANNANHLHFELQSPLDYTCNSRFDPYDLYDQVDANANPGVYASTIDGTPGMGPDPYWISDPPAGAMNEDYLDLAAIEIDDNSYGQSTGDADGIPEPDEWVELHAWLRAPGSHIYTDPFGQLYDVNGDECVRRDSNEDFATVGPGGITSDVYDYDVEVETWAPAGAEWEFYVKLWEDAGATLVNRSAYALTLGQQPYEGYRVPMIFVDDDNADQSSGDGDGVAEPGETIELIVYLQNHDHPTARLKGNISTTSPYVTLYDRVERWTWLTPGDIDPNLNDFDFLVDPSCPDNEPVEFTLDLYDRADNSFVETTYFTMNVGM